MLVYKHTQSRQSQTTLCVGDTVFPVDPYYVGLVSSGIMVGLAYDGSEYTCGLLATVTSSYTGIKSFNINDNKWKNHFYEMKGDVGMSGHERERKQEDA